MTSGGDEERGAADRKKYGKRKFSGKPKTSNENGDLMDDEQQVRNEEQGMRDDR